MSVWEAELSYSCVLPDKDVLSCPWKSHLLRLEICWLRSSVVVISVYGDIDASNAGSLVACMLGHVRGCRGLVLDMRGVDFIGAKGFSTLQKVSAYCGRTRTGWALLPGVAVSRILRICDPHGVLVTTNIFDAELAEQLCKTGSR